MRGHDFAYHNAPVNLSANEGTELKHFQIQNVKTPFAPMFCCYVSFAQQIMKSFAKSEGKISFEDSALRHLGQIVESELLHCGCKYQSVSRME